MSHFLMFENYEKGAPMGNELKAIIDEVYNLEDKLLKLSRLPDSEIKKQFHQEVTNELKSIVARAENAEAQS